MSNLKKFSVFTPDYCESLLLVVRPVGWAVIRDYPNRVLVFGQDIEFRKIGLSKANLREYWGRILSHGGVLFESVQKNAYHGRYVLLPTIAGGPGHRMIWYETDVYRLDDGHWMVPYRRGRDAKAERIPYDGACIDFYMDKLFMHGREETKVKVYGPP